MDPCAGARTRRRPVAPVTGGTDGARRWPSCWLWSSPPGRAGGGRTGAAAQQPSARPRSTPSRSRRTSPPGDPVARRRTVRGRDGRGARGDGRDRPHRDRGRGQPRRRRPTRHRHLRARVAHPRGQAAVDLRDDPGRAAGRRALVRHLGAGSPRTGPRAGEGLRARRLSAERGEVLGDGGRAWSPTVRSCAWASTARRRRPSARRGAAHATSPSSSTSRSGPSSTPSRPPDRRPSSRRSSCAPRLPSSTRSRAASPRSRARGRRGHDAARADEHLRPCGARQPSGRRRRSRSRARRGRSAPVTSSARAGCSSPRTTACAGRPATSSRRSTSRGRRSRASCARCRPSTAGPCARR